MGKIVSGLASKIIFDDCLEYGLFDWNANDRLIVGTTSVSDYQYCATPGTFLRALNCTNLTIENLDIDGNLPNLNIGGHFSPNGIQLGADGIDLNSCVTVQINSVNVHHFGLDGILILDNMRPANLTDNVDVTIRNSKFNWNGRCGFDWGGGRVVNVFNSEFNYNALGRLGSEVYDGVDWEYLGGNPMEHGLFQNCKFLYNLKAGIEVDITGGLLNADYAVDMTFQKCLFINAESPLSQHPGASYAALPGGKDFDFQQCTFYGTIQHCFPVHLCQTCISDDHAKFHGIPSAPTYGCIFREDFNGIESHNSDLHDECGSPISQSHEYLINFSDAARARFNFCTIETNKQMRLIFLAGGTVTWNNTIMNHVLFKNHGITTTHDLGSIYGTQINNSSLHTIPSALTYSITTMVPLTIIPNFSDMIDYPCEAKYLDPTIPNKVTDIFNCSGCITHSPLFCPAACYPPTPCLRMSQTSNPQTNGNDLILQPNPVLSQVLISNLHSGDLLKVFSVEGDLLLINKIESTELMINLERLKSGVYFVQAGENHPMKIIKM